MPSSPHKHRARLPHDLHAQVVDLTDQRGVPASYLAYRAVVDAAAAVLAAAETGIDPRLPPREPQVQRLPEVTWTQGQDEWELCRRCITAAGSTVQAVVIAWFRHWVAEGGSLAGQQRTPRRASRMTEVDHARLREKLTGLL